MASNNGLPHYFIAANNAIKVGKHTGDVFTKLLVEGLGVQAKSMHAIGHSLGAHLVGHFGRTIKSNTNEKIRRITGNNFDIVLEIWEKCIIRFMV